MKIKKTASDNSDFLYDNIIQKNNVPSKIPNKLSLTKNSFFKSSNRSLEHSNKIKSNILHAQSQEEDLEENININNYLKKEQKKNNNKFKERNQPPQQYFNRIENNNYFNYNKNYNYNYNLNPDLIKHFESDDMEDFNNNRHFNNANSNKNKNWKKKILEIKAQNSEEYEHYLNNNGSNIELKKFDNYNNYRNYNKNKNKNRTKNNKENKVKLNTNKNNYLSDINNNNKLNKNIKQNNNDSSSSNLYDDSYEYKTQYNFKKKTFNNNMKKYSNNSFSAKGKDKEEENFNSEPFKLPLKNDEKHYHQNLTIKIQQNLNNEINKEKNNYNEEKKKKINLSINQEELHEIGKNYEEKNKNKFYVGGDKAKKNNGNIEYPNLSIRNKYKNKNGLITDNINNNGIKSDLENIINKLKIKQDKNNNSYIEDINRKKIKEITVDLSPKKKLGLINNNRNIKRKINNNNYDNKNINLSSSNDNIKNFNLNPNSKIESCIITFDKSKNKNKSDKYKLSNSLENIKLNKNCYTKKIIISNNPNSYAMIQKQTPGMSPPNNIINNNTLINNSATRIYQKPGPNKLSISQIKPLPPDKKDLNSPTGQVKDYCAPSPNYGIQGKEAYLNSLKDKNNNTPSLSQSGNNYHIFESNGKGGGDPTPGSEKNKYDEFSFKEKNEYIGYNLSSAEKIVTKIINDNNEINDNSGINVNMNMKMENFYPKKNSNKKNNFSIFSSQRMPTFSNLDFISQNENIDINNNNNNINKEEEKQNDNLDNENNNIQKLSIKSFGNKKKEIKEKPILFFSFYKKYYGIHNIKNDLNNDNNIEDINTPRNASIRQYTLILPIIDNCYISKNSIILTGDKNKINNINIEEINELNNNNNINNNEDKENENHLKKFLTNAPLRKKLMEISANNFYMRNKLSNSLNDEYSNFNNTLDIELEENNTNNNIKKNKIMIKTVIKQVKKQKNIIKYKQNNNLNNIDINNFYKKEKTPEEIRKEKKVNSILKEDFENYINYYKNNIQQNINKKYDWSMVELLMIKIKLDIGDILQGFLGICEDSIIEDEYLLIGNHYIKNIIEHYKIYYLTNDNFDIIHTKIIKIFVYAKDININEEFKYQILWSIMHILLNNELFFIGDFNILKQTDEDNIQCIKKILVNCNDNNILDKIKF